MKSVWSLSEFSANALELWWLKGLGEPLVESKKLWLHMGFFVFSCLQRIHCEVRTVFKMMLRWHLHLLLYCYVYIYLKWYKSCVNKSDMFAWIMTVTSDSTTQGNLHFYVQIVWGGEDIFKTLFDEALKAILLLTWVHIPKILRVKYSKMPGPDRNQDPGLRPLWQGHSYWTIVSQDLH